jgi:hypothetical protein
VAVIIIIIIIRLNSLFSDYWLAIIALAIYHPKP